MRYSELVAYTNEVKSVKSDLLVIISSYNGYSLVLEHLGLLSRQSFQRFNVLLVLGVPFEDVRLLAHLKRKKYSFGAIIAKENERRGCSGAFFTGQKYALEHGYRYAIMADDDCMPVDRKLLAELYRNRKAGYVAPTTVFVEGSYRKRGFRAGPTQYSLYSTDVFRKYGLYYLPLFHGADDGEYMERVGQEPLHILQKTEHPYISGMRLFAMFDRQWLFMLQSLMIMRSWKTVAYNLVQFAFMSAASIVFLPEYGKRAAFISDRLLLTYTFGKAAGELMKTSFESSIVEKPEGSGPWQEISERDASYIDEGSRKKLAGIAFGSAKYFRKDVIVEKTYSFLRAFFVAMFAKRLYVKVGQKGYLQFADKSWLPLHLVKFPLFALALALQTLVAIAFLAVKTFRQPRTLGYGLD